MAFQISRASSSFPIPRAEVTGPVTTVQQLQHILEQSLRDLHAETHDLESTPERELRQALRRLSDQLQHILTESSDSDLPDELTALRSSPLVSSAHSVQLSQESIHLVTSCDGVILMASDTAFDVLGVHTVDLGMMSLAEWIPQEEWRVIRQHLKAGNPSQGLVSWVVTLELSSKVLQKMRCSVTPMLDQARDVTAWHWDLRQHSDSVGSHSLAPFVQSLETDLLNGQNLNESLTRICEGLVQTFGYPFVWMATVREGQRIQLRAYAVTPDLEWDSQRAAWWASVSRQEMFVQACMTSESSFVSSESLHAGEFLWFPSGFHLQEVCILPFSQGDLSGLLVVCSKMPKGFDSTVREWLKGLGLLIQGLMARGMEMEQLRLHRAVMGSVHNAVCVTDPHGRVEWINQAYTTLLGVSARHVLGTQLHSFPHSQLQEICANLDSTTTAIGCVKTEVMAKGLDGESLVLDQVLTPLVDTEGTITHFVAVLHDVTARVVAEMHLKHQAYHDALTDLPNRIMFEDRLQLALAQARREDHLVALLFLDLDNFKSINDQYGHQMGDRLLRVVAKRLLACVRTTDTVSRLSGDEFAIILQGLDRIQDIRQIAQKIVDCLSAPIHLGGQDVPVQTSIGIAVSPKDSSDPRHLLAIADQAMYRAKKSGGQCWHFSTSEWNIA